MTGLGADDTACRSLPVGMRLDVRGIQQIRRTLARAAARRRAARARSGSSIRPKPIARISSPSRDVTAACSSRPSPCGTATAPIGDWHPPSSASTMTRSAVAAARVARSSMRGSAAASAAPLVGAYLQGDSALPRRRHGDAHGQRHRDARQRDRAAEGRRTRGRSRRTGPRRACAAASPRCPESVRRWRRVSAGGAASRAARCWSRAAATSRGCDHLAQPLRVQPHLASLMPPSPGRPTFSPGASAPGTAGSTSASHGFRTRQERANLEARVASRPACPWCCAPRHRPVRRPARPRSP